MARNGTGTYVLPAGNPVVVGTIISETWANTTLTDIGTALTNSLATDGQAVVTANLPLNGYKITGLADGTLAQDAVTKTQLDAKAPISNPTFTTGTVTLAGADLAFTGLSRRITADFSATTVSTRTMLQTSVTNGSTNVAAIPNGSSTTSSFQAIADPDALDCVRGVLGVFSGSSVSVESGIVGTATYVPLLLKTSNVTQWGIEIDGRVYGSNLHNVGTVTGTAKQYLASGTYTPTAALGTNITSFDEAYFGKWTRVGNVVTVMGAVTITPTAGSEADSSFYLTIPIASNFAEVYDACGTMVGQDLGSNTSTNVGTVSADTTNDRVLLRFRNNALGSIMVRYNYQYEIL